MNNLIMSARAKKTSGRVLRMGGRADLEILKNALGPLHGNSHQSYSHQILDVLRDAIICARLPPGTSLSEIAIANVLSVSRTPVREALNQLAQENFVRIYPQAATVILPVDVNFMRECRFIRQALECANIQGVAQEISVNDQRELSGIIDNQARAMASRLPREFFTHDKSMHAFLFKISGQELAWENIEKINRHSDRMRWILGCEMKYAENAYQDHLLMFESIKAGDVSGAVCAMHSHIASDYHPLVRD